MPSKDRKSKDSDSVQTMLNFRKKMKEAGELENIKEKPELINRLDDYLNEGGPFANCAASSKKKGSK